MSERDDLADLIEAVQRVAEIRREHQYVRIVRRETD